MATVEPLTLDSYTWSTIDGVEVTESPDNGGTATDEYYDTKRNTIFGKETNPTEKAEDVAEPKPSRSLAETMNEEARLARRASRRQRPTRTRSLLDEMAADKALKNKPTTLPTENSDTAESASANADPAPGRVSKPAPRLSTERRRFMQSTLDEQEEDQAVLDDTKAESFASPASNASTTNTRVSFESIDGSLSSDTIASPITIPSASGPSSLTNPRPSLSVHTKSSASERRLSRRTSTRTSASSWSPASVFLARWSREETASAPDPDEEGQEIAGKSGYIIGRQIGYGGFSVVKEAHTIENGEKLLRAVKIVRKHSSHATENINERAQQEFEHEVTIWRYLKHKRILPLLADFDTDFATFCIMQISSGGSLFDVVAHYRRQSSGRGIGSLSRSSTNDTVTSPQTRNTMPLTHAKHYMAQIASALRYLHHDVRIVHRDIKLENCLISPASGTSSPQMKRAVTTPSSAVEPFPGFSNGTSDGSEMSSPPGDILLCDFGMADFIAQEDRDDRLTLTSLDSWADIEEPQNSKDPDDNDATPTDPNKNLGPGPNSATFSTSASTTTNPNPNPNPNPNSTTNTTPPKSTTPPPETIIAGSLPYAAPELFASHTPLYSPGADIWAFGVLSYALLVGDLPFRHGLQSRVVGMIEEGAWDVGALKRGVGLSCGGAGGLSSSHVEGVGKEGEMEMEGSDGVVGRDEGGSEIEHAVEFVEGCLRLDIERRWSVSKVLRCHFLEGYRESDDFGASGHGDGGL